MNLFKLKMQLSFRSPELATEIVTVAGDVGVHEGGRGEDHRSHPDEEQHQRGGLENSIIYNIFLNNLNLLKISIS